MEKYEFYHGDLLKLTGLEPQVVLRYAQEIEPLRRGTTGGRYNKNKTLYSYRNVLEIILIAILKPITPYYHHYIDKVPKIYFNKYVNCPMQKWELVNPNLLSKTEIPLKKIKKKLNDYIKLREKEKRARLTK